MTSLFNLILIADHEVCANYGNWNAAAGLTGGRINKFNLSKQSRDYDSQGKYIHHWVPELRNVPVPFLYEPWRLSSEQQRLYGLKVTEDYAAFLSSTTTTSSTTAENKMSEENYYPMPFANTANFAGYSSSTASSSTSVPLHNNDHSSAHHNKGSEGGGGHSMKKGGGGRGGYSRNNNRFQKFKQNTTGEWSEGQK